MKVPLLVGAVLLCLVGIASGVAQPKEKVKTKEDIGLDMAQLYKQIFTLSPTKRTVEGVKLDRNLITEPPTPYDVDQWYDSVREIGKYIKAKDPMLIDDYNTLVRFTTNMIKTLEQVHEKDIVPRQKTKIYNLARIKERINPLALNWKMAKEIRERLLEEEKAWGPSAKTKDALYLLIPFADTVIKTIEEIHRDHKKLMRGEEG